MVFDDYCLDWGCSGGCLLEGCKFRVKGWFWWLCGKKFGFENLL